MKHRKKQRCGATEGRQRQEVKTKRKHMRNQCKTGCGGHLRTEKSK